MQKRRISVLAHSCCGFVQGSIAPSLKRQSRIRNHQIEIEADGVAEALTGRARAERIVEAEEARLRLRIDRAVILALETLGEAQAGAVQSSTRLDDRRAVTFLKTGFERIHQSLANIGARDKTINQHVDIRRNRRGCNRPAKQVNDRCASAS